MTARAIEIIQLSKAFGTAQAVKGISFTVDVGEFFTFLGPSGCGKSTLLRLIAGLEGPDSGLIMISGRDMTSTPAHKRPVNLVFQSYALFPHLSVFENVAFGLKVTGSRGRDLATKVEEALALVRLQKLKDRLPNGLSGGQQQRVALARAIIKQPAVLLLDEPLSALDLKIRQEMQEELSGLKRMLPMTFVMVTHDQSEAMALSSRIAILNNGLLEQVGTPEEIYHDPQTAFVAGFIGQNNLIPGAVIEPRPGLIKAKIGGELLIWISDKKAPGALRPGEPITIWLRSHCLTVSNWSEPDSSPGSTSDGNPINRFQAVVARRSFQGTTIEYQLEVDRGPTFRASIPAGLSPGFAVGQLVTVSFPSSSASLLPASAPGQPGPSDWQAPSSRTSQHLVDDAHR